MTDPVSDTAALGGRVIVIAGASSASGRAVAERLTSDGATVVALGSDAGRLDSVAAHDRVVVDLRDPGATTDAADGILARHGRVDGVVHLVGGWRGGRDDDDWNQLLAQNVTTLRNTTRAFREALLASGDGRFVTVSSTAVDTPTWSGANYVTTKAAAEMWMRSLARGWTKAGTAAATILAVASLGDDEGGTPVAVLAVRVAALWDRPAAELNGERFVL
jgi:NAD(P)-dependent dehydrogenase (short-subunit alcohol dehydrogenase family)